MLDENTVVPKPRLAMVDPTFVYDNRVPCPIQIDVIRKVSYDLAPSWKLVVVAWENQSILFQNALEVLDTWGIPTFMRTIYRAEEDMLTVRRMIGLSDVVYAPTFLKGTSLQPMLRSPSSALEAAEVICYFSTSAEPFTPHNYYSFLNRQ